MRSLIVSLLLIAPGGAQVADADSAASRERALRREAGRAVRFLELPERRSEAVQTLLRLGPVAVAPLVRGVRHPNLEIAILCLHVLRDLGPASRSALPALDALAKGDDPRLAFAAAWARARIAITPKRLIADYAAGVVRVLDAKNQVVLRIPRQRGVWDVEALGNGNFLCCLYTAGVVHEVTPRGKVVWKHAAKSPLDADRLPDGNTLICEMATRGVIEVDPRGKVVWRYKVKGQAYDADRLPNGNTLISDYGAGEVVEVDRKGQRLWSVPAKGVFGADRLPSGNTLLCLYTPGVVREVDRRGETVWETKVKDPNEARRLPNGHTLVAHAKGALELDRAGKIVREIPSGRVGTLHQY